MASQYEAFKSEIERMVDATCADTVKDIFAAVCAEKAEHIRASYGQNDSDGALWDELATKLARIPNLGV